MEVKKKKIGEYSHLVRAYLVHIAFLEASTQKLIKTRDFIEKKKGIIPKLMDVKQFDKNFVANQLTQNLHKKHEKDSQKSS